VAGNAFAKGQPEHGADLADDLERIVALHDASTIAAVIVEPVAGSTGVLVPPKGYLERLREICDKHDILLIFDEVITGFGRLGAPFAADRFGVTPDLTMAKGLTNATVRWARCGLDEDLRRHARRGRRGHRAVPRLHLFGHPLACAAALATLETYGRGRLFARAAGWRLLAGGHAQPAPTPAT
jgi:beta-alanine--pyruvate transaminase